VPGSSRSLRKDATRLARETSRILKFRGGRLSSGDLQSLQERLRDLDQALAKDVDETTLALRIESVRASLQKHQDALKRATVREYVQSLGAAVGVALVIRAFVFEAFKIPTGSMIPSLMIEDHIFANKFAYGLRLPFTHWRFVEGGTPQRGEIVVFEYPGPGDDHGKDFIKRIVAVAGDRVRLTDNRLVINGQPIPTEVLSRDSACDDTTFSRCRCVRQAEHLGDADYVTQHIAPPPVNSAIGCTNSPDWPLSDDDRTDLPEVTVPEGHVLAMGDNRDNSSDGRFWGFLPVENAKGRAVFLWWPPGRWFQWVR
jgi:signal peptidase I